MRKCNHIGLDSRSLLSELTDIAEEALREEGEALMDAMRHEVRMTVDGGAPGRTEWRNHIAQNIEHVSTTKSDGVIIMEFGYSPNNKPDEVRAMVVGYGSGDKAEGGGEPIQAGPPGRQVWNNDLSGRKSSEAKQEYTLPDAFNQRGNHFISNAIKRTRAKFGDHLEAAFRRLPSSVFYRKVSVRKQ